MLCSLLVVYVDVWDALTVYVAAVIGGFCFVREQHFEQRHFRLKV